MLLLTLARWAQWSGKHVPAGEDETCCNESIDQDISGGISGSFDFSTASVPCCEEDGGESDQPPFGTASRNGTGVSACIDEVEPLDCTASSFDGDLATEAQHLEHQQTAPQTPHVEAKEATIDRDLDVSASSSCQSESLEKEKESSIGNCANEEYDDQKCRSSHPPAPPDPLLRQDFPIPELELFFLLPPSREVPVLNDSDSVMECPRAEGEKKDEARITPEEGETAIASALNENCASAAMIEEERHSVASALNENCASVVVMEEEEGQSITEESEDTVSSTVLNEEGPSGQSEQESDDVASMPQHYV